jgi:MFS family permease
MSLTNAAPSEEPAVAPQRSSIWTPFRVPIFRSMWINSLFASLGALIQTVAAAWMMLAMTNSADMVALVTTAVSLPLVLFSLVAGAMADSLDRRQVMLGSQVFLFVMSLVLSAYAWTGGLTPWMLLLLTFLLGCGGAFYYPASQAAVGDMVPRAQLANAVAVNSTGYNLARTGGPALGGILVAVAGVATAFMVNAVSRVGLVIVLIRWHPTRIPSLLPREPLGPAVAAGIRYVWMSPVLRTVLVRGALFGIGASAVTALMPVVAKQSIGGGALTYGLLSAAFGLGAVGGGMCNEIMRRRLSTEGGVRVGSIACALGLLVIGLSSSLWLSMFAMIIAGMAWVLALATYNVSVQLSAPRWVVARALSIYQMATYGGMAFGSWAVGVLADSRSVAVGLLAAACVLVSNAVLGRWLPLTQTEHLNLDPLWPSHEPQTTVPVDYRTGPVVVSVEYRIRKEDVLEFLTLMAERRRIRRRDGAHNCVLLRDPLDGEIWIERYETATWLEYIRHTSRMTHDDAEVHQRLRALHQGEGAPLIRRLLEQQPGPLSYTAPITSVEQHSA